MGTFWSFVFLLYQVTLILGSAPKGPWDSFNYAPKSRTVRPQSIHTVVGSVQGAQNLLTQTAVATLSGNQSYVTLDFGFEVGGLLSFRLNSVSPSSELSLSFTESPLFVNPLASDDSTVASSTRDYDGVETLETPLTAGLWTQPSERMRGGFRFLTIASTSASPASISNVTLAISFSPNSPDLRDYSGYFYSSDPVFHDKDFLTKIWYAGAYTVQTNVLPVNTGRQTNLPHGWANNATLGIAGPILVDGAKRDRNVWAGDMGVSGSTLFVSTDLLPFKNALATMYSLQDPTSGILPMAGPPLSIVGSDTYHAWNLIGTYNYYLYSGDEAFLRSIWTNYTKAVAYMESKVDSTGLMNITSLGDWGRLAGDGHSAPGNVYLYRVLTTGSELATYLNDTDLARAWSTNATALKARFHEVFWLPSAGMYRDNSTTELCPQDANSMAILFNITNSKEQTTSITKGLTKNWNEFGAVAPELPDTIAPFVGSLELQAHFHSGNDDLGMDLLRREWGYMLYTNLSVQSTLLEGYTANGSLFFRADRGYNFDPTYTSHAHGWSTGPTSVLTFYVLGLTVTSPAGKTWLFDPHTSGLGGAEGGFETPLGWFGAKWTLADNGKTFSATLDIPKGTAGKVRVPINGAVSADGKIVVKDAQGLISVDGGKHTVKVH